MKSLTAGLLALALSLFIGCSSEEPVADPPEEAVSSGETSAAEVSPVGRSEDLPLPKIATRALDVHTPEPGYAVFVNGAPARMESGELLLTPCRVQIPAEEYGEIKITIAKEGVEDASLEVLDTDESELNFTDIKPTMDFTKSLLASPLLHAEVGHPVALLSLNSPGRELDPYIEPNGLVIWFVGERTEGRAIFRAERESPLAFFNPPVILPTSQSSDLPASPSTTEDGRLIYALPERNRVHSLVTTAENSDRPDVLQSGTKSHQIWDGSQILRDGLQLYWSERSEGSEDWQGFVSTRPNVLQPFADAKAFPIPGFLPCMSADGLRQYLFDGKVLKRARRTTTSERFSSPEIIASLNLPDYRHDPHRRLFWVSEDEGWLFYSANIAGGDLNVVRLFPSPAWGYAPRGEKIAPRAIVAETKPVDPDTLPFDPPEVKSEPAKPKRTYPQVREDFVKLLKDGELEKADQLLKDAANDPVLQHDQDVLKWDREEWQAVTGFWNDLKERLRTLPPDTSINIRTAKVKFVKFDNDVIHYRTTKAGSKPLAEMPLRDLVKILEPTWTPETTAGPMQAAVLLYYDAQGDRKLAETYLKKAGEAGFAFQRRLPERLLHIAKREIDEDRVAAGLLYLERIKAEYPKTPTADAALTMEADIYKAVAWNPVGPRIWSDAEEGTYLADKTRQQSSYLVSPLMYQHFELRGEWRITEPGGSGGVFFRFAAPGKDDPYRKAFKLQLGDDKDFKPDPQSTGALHTYEAPNENASKPRGEWNTLRLRVQNLKVEIWINGKLVLDTIAQNDRIPLEGFIAIDGVNGGIAYRKLLLVELPPSVE